MKIFMFLLIIYVFIKTVSYAIFEFKTNKNKPAATTIICVALGSSILASTMIYIR